MGNVILTLSGDSSQVTNPITPETLRAVRDWPQTASNCSAVRYTVILGPTEVGVAA